MITIDSKQLATALQFVGSVVSSRVTLPILGSVRLRADGDVLTLMSTDLEVFLEDNVVLLEDGVIDICVPYKRFFDLIKQMKDTVRISVDNDAVVIKSSVGSYKIQGYSSVDFPNEFDAGGISPLSFLIDGSLLKNWLPHVLFAVGTDDLRPAMTGVYMRHDGDKTLSLVCTDGHRLSEVKLLHDFGSSFGVIIPKLAATMLSRQDGEEVQVAILGDLFASFLYDGKRRIYTRLITEPYPKYEAVIPNKSDCSVGYSVDRDNFRESVERLISFANQNTKQIRAEFGSNKLTLIGEDIDLSAEGRESLVVSGNEELVIGFNGSYMAEVLKHLVEEQAWVYMSTANRPILFDNDIQRLLLMPVMLNNYEL